MRSLRLAIAATALIALSSCGGSTSSPSAPTPAAATPTEIVTTTPGVTYTLTGTITDGTSRAGVAATVTVKDEPGAVKSGVADATGRYSILGLSPGTASVTAAAPNYVAVTKSVMMSGDKALDFVLPRVQPCPQIGFDDVGSDGAAFTTYTRCGLTVAATTSNWTVSATYGHPAPFIRFTSSAGTTTTGEVLVTAAGAKFTFQSVDAYSSTTPIPYVITGSANSITVFTIQGTQGNTFGNFATVANPNPTLQIDALLIRLTNPAAPCCSNPMGLDNIVIAF